MNVLSDYAGIGYNDLVRIILYYSIEQENDKHDQ